MNSKIVSVLLLKELKVMSLSIRYFRSMVSYFWLRFRLIIVFASYGSVYCVTDWLFFLSVYTFDDLVLESVVSI